VGAAPLTITAGDTSMTYGGTLPGLTWKGSGWVNGDSESTLSASGNSAPSCTTVAASSKAGSYDITCSGAADADYTISYAKGTLTINKAALTITADNQSMTYGGSLPALSWTPNGLVNGDTKSTLSTSPNTAPSCSTVAPSSSAGTYGINCQGAVDPDYTISYTGGTLTINPAKLSISVNNASRPVGTNNPQFTVSYNTLVNGDQPSSLSGTLVFSTNATVNSPANSYTVTASGLSSSNYAITYLPGTLTVTTNYTWNGFSQPIDDTAHTSTCGLPCPMSVFKAGSTVPVKFTLYGSTGAAITTAAGTAPQFLSPLLVSTNTPLTVTEPVFQETASTGTAFSYDGNGQYHYNWKTSNGDSGKVYQIGAQLPDGSKVYVTIGLR
jgi:hypothetical protein